MRALTHSRSRRPGALPFRSWHPRRIALRADRHQAVRLASVFLATVLLGCLTLAPRASALSPFPELGYVTNGTVNAVAHSEGVTYIGGAFSQVGPATGPSVGVSLSTAKDLSLPRVWGGSAVIDAVARDEKGGFFIGGNFTHVGGVACSNLAYIESTGEVNTSWCPNPNGTVQTLAFSGSTVYTGGAFTKIGTEAREHIAAVCATAKCEGEVAAGNATAWNPEADAGVATLAISGTTVYAGGEFTTIGGETRERIAAICATAKCEGEVAAGDATAWNPKANGAVDAIVVSGATVYAGGAFTEVGGSLRERVAAVCATAKCEGEVAAAGATAWNPELVGTAVLALAISGSTVYLGGEFTKAGGAARKDIAAVCAIAKCEGAIAASKATAWKPNANAKVQTLAVSGANVYAGGAFTEIAAAKRNFIAELNASGTVKAESWNPNANNAVDAITVDSTGATVYFGGSLSSIGGEARENLAALNSSNEVTSWSPGANKAVNALVVSGATVYAGGEFTVVSGETRKDLAAICATPKCEGEVAAGKATAWNPEANGAVRTVAISGSTVFTGGAFTKIGVETRERIAAICAAANCEGEVAAGKATAWNPKANKAVNTLAISSSTVYAGGEFTKIGTETRERIVAICATAKCEGEIAAGKATAWNPKANGIVETLAISGATVYAGGAFTEVGGSSRERVAAICATAKCEGEIAAGKATAWNPKANGIVETLAISGATVYAGGAFTEVGGSSRERVAAICATAKCAGEIAAGEATAWNPNPNGSVAALTISGSTLYAGGGFTSMETGARSGFASFREGALSFSTAPAMPTLTSIMLNGFAQMTNTTMTNFAVADATGSGAGWNVTVSSLTGTGNSAVFKQYCGEAKCGTDSGPGYVSSPGYALSERSLTLNSTGAKFSPETASPTYKCNSGCFVDAGSATTVVEAAVGNGVGTFATSSWSGTSLSLATPASLHVLQEKELYRVNLLWTLNSGP